MNINELTFGEIKEISSLITGNQNKCDHPYEVGKSYLIRTVTMCNVGRLVYVGDKELVLEDAAWFSDTGRFSQCLSKGVFNECEPFPDGKVIVGRGAIIDAALWNHKLPRLAK
jgi:hypothetical protein